MSNIKPQVKTKKEQKQIRHMKIKEKIYRRNFYIFEFGFIFIAIPLLISSLISIPFLYYYIITKESHLWPIVVVFSGTAFTQIVAMQYFFKKYYLEPNEMTLGEYLRYRLDKRIAKIKRKEERIFEKTWYDDLDTFILKLRTEMREQSNRIYSSVYEHHRRDIEN